MNNLFAKSGSILYVLWGILHLEAARKVYLLGNTLDPGIVQGRIYQDAWTLLFCALWGSVVAILFNWENSRLGYWLNLIVVSVTDIGFILFILIPAYLPLIPGALGPLLWILAAICSTIGIIKANQSS